MWKCRLDELNRSIWNVSVRDLPRAAARRVTALRVLTLAARRLRVSAAPFRASALTLYSMLSLVPTLAVGIGIAKGFGIEEVFARQIRGALPGDPHTADVLVQYANDALRQADGGVVAGIGAAALLVALIRVLSHVEYALNAIWDIQQPKPLRRRLADHLALVLIAPLGLAVAGAANVTLAAKLRETSRAIPFLTFLHDGHSAALTAFAWIVASATMAFVYYYLPNTRVRFGSATLAGGFAATLLLVSQWVFVRFQTQIADAGAVYGGFAFLPLLILWFQTSWLLFLLGAGVGYAHQHGLDHEFDGEVENMSTSARRRFAVLVAHHLAETLSQLRGPSRADDVAREMGLPRSAIKQALDDLRRASVAVVAGSDDGSVYTLAWPLEALTLGRLWEALDRAGGGGPELPHGELADRLAARLAELETSIRDMAEDSLLGIAEQPTSGR